VLQTGFDGFDPVGQPGGTVSVEQVSGILLVGDRDEEALPQ
jgi:hypothetical protein